MNAARFSVFAAVRNSFAAVHDVCVTLFVDRIVRVTLRVTIIGRVTLCGDCVILHITA